MNSLFLGLVSVYLLVTTSACDSRLAIPSSTLSPDSQNSVILAPLVSPAVATDILNGKKVYDENGAVVVGTMTDHGSWNSTTSFPGSGYYSGVSDTPTGSQICTAQTILGISGSAVCQSASGGTNAVSANVLSGTYFWESSGQSIQGTMADKGSNWNLTTAFPGAGYYSGINSSLGSGDVCSSKTFLGTSGTAVCQSGSASLPASPSDVIAGKEFWDSTGAKQTGTLQSNLDITFYSMAFRNDTDSVVPNTSSQRGVATLSQEASNAQAFQDYHKLVPNPKYDTDGTFEMSGVTAPYHLETITGGRPSVTCGTSGTLETRIADCSTQNGNRAFYDGKNFGQNGEGDWKLVTRTANGYEVWRDERTKLLWSDSMSTKYNWYQAAGYASTDSNTNNTGGYDARPGIGVQPNPPLSVCADAALIPTLSGYQPFTTPSANDERKGNLTFAGTLSVTWRLPTIEDWKLAEVNGLRKVLPDLDSWFWSATSSSHASQVQHPWMFYGTDGGVMYWNWRNDTSSAKTRCIGH